MSCYQNHCRSQFTCIAVTLVASCYFLFCLFWLCSTVVQHMASHTAHPYKEGSVLSCQITESFSHCLCVVLFYIFCSWTSTLTLSSIIFCAVLLELVYDNDMVCFECMIMIWCALNVNRS